MKRTSNSKLSKLKRKLLGLPEIEMDSSIFIFGEELHSESLEYKRNKELSPIEEYVLMEMVDKLRKTKEFTELLKGAMVEIELEKLIDTVPVLGRIDILNKTKNLIADLKTTSSGSYNEFLQSCIKWDYFRQAYIYQRLTGIKNFYFIGIQKTKPYRVIILNVNDHPRELWAGIQETKFLLYFYKNHENEDIQPK